VWKTVDVAGVLEGELPQARRDIDEERRLFAIATSRATGALIAVAAPAPGVLLSRFVESWPLDDVKLPMAPGRRLPPRPPTAGPVPVYPEGRLHLSASQLDTYSDCPLRYAYQYVARAREESGIHAALGTLVHDVLADYLDPEAADLAPRTFEGLMAVAGAVWSDEIGKYRPQIEEARRDFVTMLTNWWTEEGVHDPRPLAVEHPFDVEVGPHRLVGRIDRIDRAPDGRGVRVIDYKTGKKEPRSGDVADDLQLAVYHLAATRDPELAALGPPTQLQLWFLRTMRRFDQPVTDDHVERTEGRVLAVADRMLAEDFTPSVEANCRNCSYHRLCPLQAEGRQT
jgi:RecB family exonuclease